MHCQASFIDLVRAGEVVDPETAIEGWIQRWHEGESDGPLHDYLGMAWDEYSLFVERPEFLRAILVAKQQGISLMSTVALPSDEQAMLAAQGVPVEDLSNLRRWLEETGRL